MKKNQSSGKVKLLLFIAIAVIVLLIVISVVQLYFINEMRKTINEQQDKIDQLYEQHEFYETPAPSSLELSKAGDQ